MRDTIVKHHLNVKSLKMLEWLALAEIIFMNKLCYKKKGLTEKNVMLKVACDH